MPLAPSSAAAIVVSLLLAGASLAAGAQNAPSRTVPVKIRIVTEHGPIVASLSDTPASRDFLALLPLKLTLGDHAATEKIADLPERLSKKGAPAGYAPRTGDMAYYAPWGNLALYHKDFRYSDGLIKLGQIDEGLAILRRSGAMRVTVERVEPAQP